MYSPKIREDLVPRIYKAAKEAKLPMTTWVNLVLKDALPDTAPSENTERKTHNMRTDEHRQAQAETETFVIAKTAEGFRVCSPLNPATQYVVSGIPDAPHCTCPDYDHNEGDPEWLCKHILAVYKQMQPPPAPAAAPTAPSGEPPAGNGRLRRSRNGKGPESAVAMMVIKRSVSPDRRIDSLSVEFACPVGDTPAEAVKECAEQTLRLQTEIVESFLAKHGRTNPNGGAKDPEPNGALPARLLKVEGMNTKWGRRLFVAVQVSDQTLKLFGTLEQLSEALKAAGYPTIANRIAEGTELNLPCLVVTKPSDNGKYVNVERVLPARN